MGVRDNRNQHFEPQETSSTPAKSMTGKQVIGFILIVGIIVFLILIHINQYVQLSRKNVQLEQLKEKKNQLKSEKAHLQLKISNLMSLDRIEKRAKQELGMKEPQQIQYVKVASSQDDNLESVTEESQDKSQAKPGITEQIMAWFHSVTNVQADTLQN
ncbi:cell division protein FtsL [Halanaerobaculum tunisiense]